MEKAKTPQNVWLKRLGLFLLLGGMFPQMFQKHEAILTTVFIVIVVMSIITYFLINIVSYFKSLS